MSDIFLESPYLSGAPLHLKGNLHTHTTKSDGTASPQDAAAHYARLGYDFLQLSDHDIFESVEALDDHGLILLAGVELSCAGTHILDVSAKKLVSTAVDRQKLLDTINATSGFPVLCHPNWGEDFDHFPYSVMAELNGYVGIEIFNAAVIGQPGNPLALDKWDRLLAAGKKVWGFANDDTHNIKNAGRGWNVVLTRERTRSAILDGVRRGSFYASTGVTIEEIAGEGSRLTVRAPDADCISVIGRHGVQIQTIQGPLLILDVSDLDTPYVRIQCYGRCDAMAWSQPVYIRGGKHDLLLERLRQLSALEKAVLRAWRSNHMPRLTGRRADAVWQRAQPHTRFFSMKDGEPCPFETEVHCVVAGTTLVFALRCEEPELDHMKLQAQCDGQPNIWTDDSFEIFLDPGLTRKCAFQVMVNARGLCAVVPRGPVPFPVPSLRAVAAQWSEGSSGGWSVELAVHLPEAAAPYLRPGCEWGLHICRNRNVGERTSYAWSWVGSSNHNIREYGTLCL
ncbi:MAG: hypothetical protein ACUVWX_06255 [Kiritimatiellia bacterium]